MALFLFWCFSPLFLSPFLQLFHVSSPSCAVLFLQEGIDIYKGVQDDQALRMAANLGFKGPLQRQVMSPPKALKLQC